MDAIIRQFEHWAMVQPDAPAIIWKGERITYARLRGMVGRARERLRRPGPPDRRPFAILARKSPEAVALIMACLTERRPFLLPSVELPAPTLRALLAQAGCAGVLSPDPALEHAFAKPDTALAEAAPDTALAEAADVPADDALFLLTTSGSTGVPKIVPLPAAAVDRFTDWACARFGIGPGKTVLNYAPLNFDLCFLDVWASLKGGACVALVDQDRATSPAYLLGLLADARPHVVQAVPMLYRLLADATRPEGSDGIAGAAEHVIFTGDRMPSDCLEALPSLFPGARYYNVYGCTETNDSFIHELDLPAGPPAGPVPIGTPLPGVSAHLVDDEGATLEGPGLGELIVATPFQARGYLGGQGDSDKFHLRREYGVPRTYFRSGDLVRRHADGTLTLEGRKDFHVKVRGTRVNTQEVERVILEHGDVLEGAVVAVPCAVAGHRLQAVVRRKGESGLTSLDLFQHCARNLARTAVPVTFRFSDTALPRTSTGKIDRRQLLQA